MDVKSVVIGWDGSTAAEAAIAWGVQVAQRRGAPIRVVSAIPWPYDSLGLAPQAAFDAAEVANEVATQGRDKVVALLGDPDRVVAVGVPTTPATALVTESATAGLVVIGNKGRSRIAQVFTGSATVGVVAHAQCDVAVVPAERPQLPGPDRPVVVGVDGSDTSLAAAVQAGQIAAWWNAPLRIVQTWNLADALGWSGGPPGATFLAEAARSLEEAARTSVDRTAEAVRQAHPGVHVETQVLEQHPAHVLAELSETAGLVVVGTRGLGGFERLMLGSVSRYLVQHAAGPVIVVRGARRRH